CPTDGLAAWIQTGVPGIFEARSDDDTGFGVNLSSRYRLSSFRPSRGKPTSQTSVLTTTAVPRSSSRLAFNAVNRSTTPWTVPSSAINLSNSALASLRSWTTFGSSRRSLSALRYRSVTIARRVVSRSAVRVNSLEREISASEYAGSPAAERATVSNWWYAV